MYINKQTNQVVSEQEIRLAYPNTSFTHPFNPPDEYAWVFPIAQASYDPITQFVREVLPELTLLGHYEQRFEVVDLEAEQAEANQIALNATRIKTTEDKIDQLWRAADSYVSSYISGVAIGLLTIGLIQQLPKALAVTAWSSGIWAEYYQRKALVTYNSEDNLDFSSFGGMPHSVPELQAELGM